MILRFKLIEIVDIEDKNRHGETPMFIGTTKNRSNFKGIETNKRES